MERTILTTELEARADQKKLCGGGIGLDVFGPTRDNEDMETSESNLFAIRKIHGRGGSNRKATALSLGAHNPGHFSARAER